MAKFGMFRITLDFTDIVPVETAKVKRSTGIDVSNSALEIPTLRDDVLEFAHAAADLSKLTVSVSCDVLGIKREVVKLAQVESRRDSGFFVSRFGYKNYSKYGYGLTRLTIPAPQTPESVQFAKYLKTKVGGFTWSDRDIEAYSYLKRAARLNDILLKLLNYQPHANYVFTGFVPMSFDTAAAKSREKRSKLEQREREKLEKRLAKQKEKRALNPAAKPPTEPKTGAGRTVGARPGIFDGVQMRSQLEIRVAAELKERGIHWVYESEAVGPAGYLVDFYLPELGVWIEAKGRFDARDRILLPEVARVLKERGERLLVYTSSGPCYIVNSTGQREVERTKFWNELLR